MKMTPQERFALVVVALLLAGGIFARNMQSASPVAWIAEEQVAGAAVEGASLLTAQVQQEVTRSRRRARPLAPGEQIDPNTADVDELQRLPRVGPALAARIVAHREAHGAFRTLADLDAVSGVGPALLEAVTPHVALAPVPPTAPPPPTGNAAGTGARGQSRPAAAAPANQPLDLNGATAEELVRLPGIGPVLAARVVEWRQANARFRTVEDLQQVPGIGPKTLEKLRPLIRVSP